MITAGIVVAAVGIVISLIGASMHLKNIQLIASRKADQVTGRKMIAPFALLLPGGLATGIGILLALIGVAFLLFG